MKARGNSNPRAVLCPSAAGAVAIALLAAFGVTACNQHGGGGPVANDNVVLNGDLTQGSGVLPDHWANQAWDANSVTFKWNHTAGAPGELEISSTKANDANWSQVVNLGAGWYHFTASLKAENIPESGTGVHLWAESWINSPDLHGTTDWKTVGFYLKVGESTHITFGCRLGGFSNLNSGTGFCKDFKGVKTEEPPADAGPRFDLDQLRGGAVPKASSRANLFGSLTAILVVAATLFMTGVSGAGLAVRRSLQSARSPGASGGSLPIDWRHWLVTSEPSVKAADLAARQAAAPPGLSTAILGFFLFAIILSCTDIALLVWMGRERGPLVLPAAIIALGGLALSPVGRRTVGSRITLRGLDLSLEGWSILAVFAAFLAFFAATSFGETAYNEQVRQAVAFLHGHTYINVPTHSYIEYAEVGPYRYALHPPLAPILLMPLALIWGMATPQSAFSLVVGAVDAALAWWLLGRFRLATNARVWMTFFFTVGTILWFETVLGTTWALPMVVSVVFTLAALIEAFGQARPLWLGIFAALASFARYDLALCAPLIWRWRTCAAGRSGSCSGWRRGL